MEEVFVTNFVSDGTPIPIWEVSDITGITVEELMKTAETITVKIEVKENGKDEKSFK